MKILPAFKFRDQGGFVVGFRSNHFFQTCFDIHPAGVLVGIHVMEISSSKNHTLHAWEFWLYVELLIFFPGNLF